MLESIKDFIPPIHKEGYIFIIIFLVVTFILYSFSTTLGWIGIILTVWCALFFRDPVRVTPLTPNLIISPADGLVQKITRAYPPSELNMDSREMTRISIFLNVFDVHVNRIPISGRIKELHYHPGKFFNASLDKASVDNERQSVLITTHDNQDIAVVQIAGLIARRIVCDLNKDQEVNMGEKFGIIRFGSRADVYIPTHIEPTVLEGQRVIGGETILAKLDGDQHHLTGQAR